MDITINDVLKLEGFKDAKVIAGHSGLKNTVKKATLMEVPDIFPFVDENCLIITTLYPIFDNIEKMKDLIPTCSKLSVSGICIKTARYVDKIPQFMIDQANKLSFPIIELCNKDNLSDLVSEIINLSLDKHIDELKFQNYIHNHLMNIFLKGENVDGLIDEFSKLVNYPIILLDNQMELLSISRDLFNKDIKIDISDKEFKHIALTIHVDLVSYTNENYIKHSIEAGNNKFGYLILLYGTNSINNNLIRAVEEASLLIASSFYKSFAVMEKEKNFQDSFIRDILNGVSGSQMEVIMKAKAYGWNLEFPQALLILEIFDESEVYKKKAYEMILGTHVIENIINKKIYMKDKNTKIIYIDESLVIFVNVTFINDINEQMIELGNQIKLKLEKNYRLGIGISNIILNSNSFPTAYKEARDALSIGNKFHTNSFISHYKDYQFFSIIENVNNKKLLHKYVNNKIGKILEYDKTANMNLMNTLITLTETCFNHKEASKKLFIHYNTMRYRIERLKELGVDISNGLEITEMIFAYYINIWLENNRDSGN